MSETWTAPTWFYSVDIHCETPTREGGGIDSSDGCHYNPANIRVPDAIKDDQYQSLYLPRDNKPDFFCILVTWKTNKASSYRRNYAVLQAYLLYRLINITDFEWSMSQGYEVNNNRGEFPTSSWPDPTEKVQSTFPHLYRKWLLPPKHGQSSPWRIPASYLDAETLKDSYQAAYRLMLAQKLVDILSKDFTTNETYSGTRFHESEALIMVPTFVYVVEGLLATTVIAALLIAAIPSWRKTSLTSEPANLAAMMALSSNDHLTAETMSDKDFATSDELERVYHETTFASIDGDQGPTLHCINPDSQVTMYDRSERPAIPVLPFELSWYFGIGFFALQSLVVVALIFAYVRTNHNNGDLTLAMPMNKC
ncbi:hypothetical protein E4T43_04238 [Aureobasidium subglaciale]|nr:hypothetical protein E4T43_04238 [Aureobasidium subglaciale]